MGSRDYGNGGRPYPNSNSTSRKSFDLESNNINSNSNSNNNIGMSMSNASSMREKYMRDPEIEKIAEGNEEEGEGEDNGDEFRSEIASSTMSYATLAPFYQPKAKKTTDFSNKEDVLFSYENVMHSSKKSPPDSLSIRSSNINSNVNTSGNSNSQKEDVYQEIVFQDNPMGR